MNASTLFLSVPDLAHVCRRYGIHRLAVFGSATREDFDDKSDIDLLVDFELGMTPGLLEMIAIEDAMTQLLGRKVDLVERASVAASDNYIRRQHILGSAQDIYVAR